MMAPWRKSIQNTRSKRVKMLFSVLTSPYRLELLRILNSRGPLAYSDLKTYAGFHSKKESGKFAYHLRKLGKQSLIMMNKSEKRYIITNIGKLVINLAREVEERSITESGKMYVRTSYASMEEFDPDKITRSLITEGNVPLDLAQKITEDVEERVYRYHPSYLTGSLIREMVNNILVENGYEDYHNKMIRLGMPIFKVQKILSDSNGMYNGTDGLFAKAGQAVLSEYLFAGILPRNTVDSHIQGDLHITNPGLWSLLPDTVFVDMGDLIRGGFDFGGRLLEISKIPHAGSFNDLYTIASMAISLISKEASQEVVLDGLAELLENSDNSDLERRISNMFILTSTTSRHSTSLSFVLHLGHDDIQTVNLIIAAYYNYVRITSLPHLGLIIDYTDGDISDVSAVLARVISIGGRVSFSRGLVSNRGISMERSESTHSILSVNLHSLSINLPRLAFESVSDEEYFRTRMALLMNDILPSLEQREQMISDHTRHGFNPFLAKQTELGSTTLFLNLTGLHEAVFNTLDYRNSVVNGHKVLCKVVETAVDEASKKSRKREIKICMIESDGASRFVTLDGERYGKNTLVKAAISDSYSEGLSLDAMNVGDLTADNLEILTSNKVYDTLQGNILVDLKVGGSVDTDSLKRILEKTSYLIPSFRPTRQIFFCRECGQNVRDLTDTCTTCKSPYIIQRSNHAGFS